MYALSEKCYECRKRDCFKTVVTERGRGDPGLVWFGLVLEERGVGRKEGKVTRGRSSVHVEVCPGTARKTFQLAVDSAQAIRQMARVATRTEAPCRKWKNSGRGERVKADRKDMKL